MKNKIRVAELFAGVGGFRIGLEGYNGKSATSNFTKKLESIFEAFPNLENVYLSSTALQDGMLSCLKTLRNLDCNHRLTLE